MSSRWFGATVVILWLITMTWLVKDKVLPLILVGEPPSISNVIEAQRGKPAVGWKVLFDDQPLGWALADTKLQKSGLTEIRGRVHFDSLPLDKVIPGWLQPLSRIFGSSADKSQLDAGSLLTVDGLGHQVRFDLTLLLEPLKEIISVRGTVEGGQAMLQVRMPSGSFEQSVPLSSSSLLSDALSPQPQTELPGLRTGQTWTVPIYTPLWPEKNRLEIFRATVLEGMQPITWNGEVVSAFVVEYRSESRSGPGSRKPHGRLWVRRDGVVLRQEAMIFGSTITFDRMSDLEAKELVMMAGPQWWNVEGVPQHHD
jgi:hypothetical protein